LKIRRGKEVCVYRTSKAEDKKALLGAFRQVSQELGEKKRKESEKEQIRRKSMWQEQSPASPNALNPGLSMIGVSTDNKDLRWIDEYGDDLSMAIATRDWDEAVKLVEKGEADYNSRLCQAKHCLNLLQITPPRMICYPLD
jgi:hypothetical protein